MTDWIFYRRHYAFEVKIVTTVFAWIKHIGASASEFFPIPNTSSTERAATRKNTIIIFHESVLMFLVLHICWKPNTLCMGVEVTNNTSIERHTARFSAHTASSSDRRDSNPKVIEIVDVRLDQTYRFAAFNMETNFAGRTMIAILFNFQLACSALGSSNKWNSKVVIRMN